MSQLLTRVLLPYSVGFCFMSLLPRPQFESLAYYTYYMHYKILNEGTEGLRENK